MNNEMKVRTSNILIAVFWVVAAFVWAPTLLTELDNDPGSGWLRDLGMYGRYGISASGFMVWAAITGAVVAAQYFVTGTVRFKFQKQ